MATVKAIQSKSLSSQYAPRYIIVDSDTGEILDDAQGYGYTTQQKAYAAYGYKTRDKSKDKEKAKRRSAARQWSKEHKSFMSNMEDTAFQIAKGSYGPNDVFNSKYIAKMLKDAGYTDLPFSPADLLKCWEKS